MTTELEAINDALEAIWSNYKLTPDTIYISSSDYIRIVRRGMSKRQFRRWRGKFRAFLRQHACDDA